MRHVHQVYALCSHADGLGLAGVSRNEDTLQPTVYLNKLRDTFAPDTRVLVSDPMLATGMRLRLRVCSGLRF